MTDAQQVRHMLDVRIRLARALARAQEHRDERQPLGWVAYERAVMLRLVNEERGMQMPVTLADIERVEGWALGHSDYSSKFALYCAELAVYGPSERAP